MKIGIFGDSYGQYNGYIGRPDIEQYSNDIRKTWWDYLSDDGLTVENKCVAGSNLYYSYTQFKKFYRSYDYIIVLVTNWSRYWLPQLNTIYPHVPGYKQAEHYLKICKDEDDELILKALLDYFMYIEDETYLVDMSKLMCKEMLSLHKKVLLIPCFNPTQSIVPDWTSDCLEDISRIDSDFYNVDLYKHWCHRHGHINDANHYILYQKISEWIKAAGSIKFNINIQDYKKPSEPFEHNFFIERPLDFDFKTGELIHAKN